MLRFVWLRHRKNEQNDERADGLRLAAYGWNPHPNPLHKWRGRRDFSTVVEMKALG